MDDRIRILVMEGSAPFDREAWDALIKQHGIDVVQVSPPCQSFSEPRGHGKSRMMEIMSVVAADTISVTMHKIDNRAQWKSERKGYHKR